MLETNDPKLTAFAFGELPAEEQAEVAAIVAASPALASEVAAIRGLGEQLTVLLATEACPALSETERTAILQAAEQVRPAEASVATAPAVRRALYRQRRFWTYATAATLLMALTLFFAIPLAVRYTQEPVYRTEAWLRVEEAYVVYAGSGELDDDEGDVVHQVFDPHQEPTNAEEESTPQPLAQDEGMENSPLLAIFLQQQSRIADKLVEQELLKAEAKAYEENLTYGEIEIDEEALETEALAIPEVKHLSKELDALRKSAAELPSLSGKDNSKARLEAFQQQTNELKQKRNELLDETREKIRERLIAAERKSRQAKLDEAITSISRNQLEIDLLRERFFAQREEMNRKGSFPLDLLFKQSELRLEEQVVEMISRRIMRLRTEMTAPAIITLLRKAEPPANPVTSSLLSFWTTEREPNQRTIPGAASPVRINRTFLMTQAQLIHSPLVLEQVLARPDVAKYAPLVNLQNPVAWLSKRIKVFATPNSELFIIEFECDDPEYSALITNYIVEAYFRMHTQDEAQRSTRVVELLEDEQARRLVIIHQLQEQIKELKARMVDEQKKPSVKE